MKAKINNLIKFFQKYTWLMVFLAFPMSNSYQLENYSFGNGGGNKIGSSNYDLQGEMGNLNSKSVGNSYDLNAGLAFTRQSSVPKAPILVNPGNYYNKLHLTLDNTVLSGTTTAAMPSDTKFAIAISSDNFTTTQYVKSDHTVGSTLAATDYQTYAAWGQSTGFDIVGLGTSTTYTVKVKSMQGKFSESQYGPTVSAATIDPSLNFDIDVSSTDQKTDPPYQIDFGDLIPGAVTTSSKKVWVDFGTNATSGGSVYVYGQNGGLYSTTTQYTISSVNGNLDLLNQGVGIQVSSASQGSGGPLLADALYNLSSNNVGIGDTSVRQLFYSISPIVSGRGSFLLKAKSANDTPSANDYSEILTVIASGNF